MLAAMAQATRRIRIGCQVTGMIYRHPAVLANMAATVDIISGGRLELGLGAGWNQMECDAYGIDLPPLRERFDRFDEGVEAIVSLLSQPVTTFTGQYVKLTDARCEPKPVQRPHPPVTIGGRGKRRTLRAVARWAQQWNALTESTEQWLELKDVLAGHCAAIGRDVSEITCSVNLRLGPDADPEPVMATAAAYRDAGVDLMILNLPHHMNPAALRPLAEAFGPLAVLVARQPLMQGPAGVGHQRRHAEFGQHAGGRFHLGRPAYRVLPGPVNEALDRRGAGRREFGGDVLAQPRLIAGGPGGVKGLDHGGGHALIEHAAQELPAGREARRAVKHLDVRAEGPQRGGVARRAAAAGEHRDTQAAPGYRGHHRDVGEGYAGRAGDFRQLPLGAWRGGIQVGPQRVRPQPGPPGPERVDRGLRAVDAQHQVRPPHRLGLAVRAGDALGRGYRGVITPDLRPGQEQVACDQRAGLPQAEYGDDHPGHHTRGCSALTLA
jgi:alkanesulfonate monooxygenase SsuD/methylene tetrahydromethanopterin reductase-like flavin-dependent oxidoreductase (luciferase family)